jgi:hypothetical protein
MLQNCAKVFGYAGDVGRIAGFEGWKLICVAVIYSPDIAVLVTLSPTSSQRGGDGFSARLFYSPDIAALVTLSIASDKEGREKVKRKFGLIIIEMFLNCV